MTLIYSWLMKALVIAFEFGLFCAHLLLMLAFAPLAILFNVLAWHTEHSKESLQSRICRRTHKHLHQLRQGGYVAHCPECDLNLFERR